MRLLASLALAAFGALVLVGCGSPAASSSPSPSDAPVFVGEWKGEGKSFLSVQAGTELTGSDGCNGFSGTYTLDGPRIIVDRGVSTLKACMGVDTWLSGIRSAEIDGDTLVVYDKDDQQIGTLERAAS